MEGVPDKCFVACPFSSEELPVECKPYLNCKGPVAHEEGEEIIGQYEVELSNGEVSFNDEHNVYAEFGNIACRNKGIINFLREKSTQVR